MIMEKMQFTGALMEQQENFIELYELARDVLGDLVSCCSFELDQEGKHAAPDASKIEALKAERHSYLDLKESIPLNDAAEIERIIDFYSPKARARIVSVNATIRGVKAVR